MSRLSARVCIGLLAVLVVVGVDASLALADTFVLTDKSGNNAVAIEKGNTASMVYVTETKDDVYAPSGNDSPGFRFNATNGVNPYLDAPNAGDATYGFQQGYSQSLAGNADNGYVGTMIYKAWGNAIHLSFDNHVIVNGAGADLYITSKNLIGNVAQGTSSMDKSIAIALHIGGVAAELEGWHLYNPEALPLNFQPDESGDNTNGAQLGALDLSDLPLVAGLNDDLSGLGTIGAGAFVDEIILINNNTQNAWSWYYLPGHATANENDFLMLRDYDNADGDNNPFTGRDGLTGRHGSIYYNGQDAPQAWFVGGLNMGQVGAPVPEPDTLALLGLCAAAMALSRVRRRRA